MPQVRRVASARESRGLLLVSLSIYIIRGRLFPDTLYIENFALVYYGGIYIYLYRHLHRLLNYICEDDDYDEDDSPRDNGSSRESIIYYAVLFIDSSGVDAI